MASIDHIRELFAAVQSGDVKSVGTIIYQLNVPIDTNDSEGYTPLIVACQNSKPEVIQFLLEHGADVKFVGANKNTALHSAAQFGEVEAIRSLVGFGADVNARNGEGLLATDLAKQRDKAGAAIVKELGKPLKSATARSDDAARFKAHGNKVFAEGENVKAAKFYAQAIQNDQLNHVYFSNRAACSFNLKDYSAAYLDACRCIALNPKFVRGYFRKAAALNGLKDTANAKKTISEGLAVEAQNKDLLNLLDQINKQHN